MALRGRLIKNRIKSIKNTRKITKAMEMVSVAKMQRAIKNVLATRPYSDLAWHFLGELVKRTDPQKHYLLERREVKKVGLVLISSNRGLCGGFNSQIVQKALKSIKVHEEKVLETEFITFGKRGRDILLKSNCKIVADFEKPDVIQNILEIRPLTHLIINEFRDKKYDKIMLIYTDFVSSLSQIPHVKHLLPVELEADERLGKVEFVAGQKPAAESKIFTPKYDFGYIFEPSIDAVLKSLLPRLVEVQMYQAALESDASEHSARMVAMKNASDAAQDMIYDLTLAFNQARQAGITKEIAEISAGQAAIK